MARSKDSKGKSQMESETASGNKNRSFFGKLKRPSQFSKVQLAIFIIVFGAIGYFIIHSLAAAPLVASVEGENMIAQGGGTGTSVNLALNKPATASSAKTSSLSAANAFDGNSSTRWGSNYSDPQWLRVDLGSTQSFSQVIIKWETAYGKAFQIQTSNDGSTWTTVYSTTTGTGGTQTINASGSGRYVRMYGTVRATKWGYSIYEMQVMSQVTTTPASANLALNKPATASSTQTYNGTVLSPSSAFDGNTSTRWSSNYSDPQWLQVDLGSTQSFSQVVIQWETAYAKAFQIQTSNDGSTWTTVYSTTTGTGGTQTINASGSGRYVRMYGTVRGTSWGYSIYEMQVMGSIGGSSGFSQVVTDAAASNGKEMELTGNGTINATFSLPSNATSLTVVAKSDLCSSVGGAMTVSVDSSQLISTTVNSTSLASFTASPSLAAGTHTLSISYTNDTSTSSCDRNLYIDVTNFYGPNLAPTVSISASPTSIIAGQSSTITWSSTNATSCTASGAWSGSEPTSGSISTGALNNTSTYTITCTGSGGTSPPASATVTVTTPVPTAKISASPTTINSGQSSTLTWSSTDATSCTASGAWSGSLATSGSQSVSPTATSTYSLTCTGSGGTSSPASAQVTVGSGSGLSLGASLFADEFNGAKGGLPDCTTSGSTSKWAGKTYTNHGTMIFAGCDINHVSEDGSGNLVITATADTSNYASGTWHSGEITGGLNYGYSGQRYIEARANTPCDLGTWSAPIWEWAYPYGSGGFENDVNEQLGKQPTQFPMTLHNWDINKSSNTYWAPAVHTQNICGSWHTYGAAVYKDRVDYYFDGVKVQTILASEINASDLTTYKEVAAIDLDMGGWGGTIAGPGPYKMSVDYYHVNILN